jgi:uncharacterized membrane protein
VPGTIKEFSTEEIARLKAAIGAAEKRTAGEIRVFIEDASTDEPLDRAAFLFGELGMHKTESRNGILVYLAVRDKKYGIIGDYGIHEKVGADFWNRISERMVAHFREGRMIDGLCDAVADAGEALAKYFPYTGGDRNELPDDILFGKNNP